MLDLFYPAICAKLIEIVTFTNPYYTPMEVEGLTIDSPGERLLRRQRLRQRQRLKFYHRNEWKPIPLAEITPRIFSEVMRDLDLVVSVAHIGGVDPEAST